MRKFLSFQILLKLCSVFFLNFELFAQKIDATLSLSPKEPRPLWFDYCKIDNGLITLAPLSKSSKRNLAIYKYDENFKRQWVKPVYEQNLNSDVANLSVIGENILLFINETYNKEQITKMFHLDLNGNKIKENVSLLKLENNSKFSNLKFKKSFNTKKLLGFTFFIQKNLVDFRFISFYNEDNELHEGKFEIPFQSVSLEIFQVEISNQGNIFVLAKEKKGKGNSPNDFQYLLYKYQPIEQKLSSLPLEADGRFITDIIFKLDKNEDIFLGGFYSNLSSNSVIGTVYIRADSHTMQVVNQKYDQLDKSFLERYLSEKQIYKGRELEDFYLDKMVLRSDGGIVLFAERFYSTYSSSNIFYGYYGPGMYYRDRIIYNYNDVAVLSIDNEGKIEWNSIVEKRQSSEFPSQLSYFPVITPEKVVIFYKYHIRGIGTNIYYQIVQEGKVNSQPRPFFQDFSARDYFYRSACEQISNHEAILVIYKARGRLFTFYKISF